MKCLGRDMLMILTVIVIEGLIYGLASPFLPGVLEEKGISTFTTGIIFAASPAIIVCMLTGPALEKIGHVRMLGWGAMTVAVGSTCLGVLPFLDNKAVIVTLCITFRFLQDIGGAMFCVSTYSYVSVSSKNHVEVSRGISYLEGTSSLAICVSPIISSYLYELVGFSKLNFIFGGAMIPASAMLLCLLKEPTKPAEDDSVES